MDEVRHTEQFQYIDLVIEIVQFVCAPVRSGVRTPEWSDGARLGPVG